MAKTILNNLGEKEIDPYDSKGRHERWIKSITLDDGKINYNTFKDISPQASELLTTFILDLSTGKNVAKGSKKGKRSDQHLVNIRQRLNNMIMIFEKDLRKDLMEFNEDNILDIFNRMRQGTMKNKNGTPYLSVCTYAKAFGAFWRWIVRQNKKKGILTSDIVESLDTSPDRKPKWTYFSLNDIKKKVVIRT